MKKGVLVVAAVVVAIAAGAGGWWLGRDRAADDAAAEAAQAKRTLTPQARATRERNVRASVDQHRRLWREASYVEIRQAAMDGDPVAQRRLSEVYEDCLAFATAMSGNLRMLRQLARADRAARPAVSGIFHDYKRLCVQAEADLRKNANIAAYWLHRSAKAGDLASEMRYFGRTVTEISQGQLGHFVDKLRESGDPAAMFELSLLLPKMHEPWPDAAQAPAFTGPVAQNAWAVAACRAGHDCATGSRVMTLMCVGMLICTPPDYESSLRATGVYPAQKPEVERLVGVIRREVLDQAAPPAR